MALAYTLFGKTLVQACPHCANRLRKKGSWFATVRSYHCAGCARRIVMTYSMKTALFTPIADTRR